MNEGTRFGTAMHSPKVVQDSDAYTQSTDGKGKAPPPDGRIFLVGLSLRALPPSRRLALQPETSTIFKSAAAVATSSSRSACDEQARGRLPRPARPHSRSPSWCQAAKDLCRRGDAGCEEGGHSGKTFGLRKTRTGGCGSDEAGEPPSRCRFSERREIGRLGRDGARLPAKTACRSGRLAVVEA